MPYFRLCFEQLNARNRSFSALVEADDKHKAAEFEEDARRAVEEWWPEKDPWSFNGADPISAERFEQDKDIYPVVG